MQRELREEDLDIADLIDIDEFIGMVIEGEIGDEDGAAFLVYDEDRWDTKELPPSDIAFHLDIPEDVTHVLWQTV